jgi:hypothetical protein
VVQLAEALVEYETLDLQEVKKVIKGEPIRSVEERLQDAGVVTSGSNAEGEQQSQVVPTPEKDAEAGKAEGPPQEPLGVRSPAADGPTQPQGTETEEQSVGSAS